MHPIVAQQMMYCHTVEVDKQCWRHNSVDRLLQVAAVALFNSGALLLLTNVGTCKPCDPTEHACAPGVRHDEMAFLKCQAGEYNDIATLVVSPTGALLQACRSFLSPG
jgi:hypothetical protein